MTWFKVDDSFHHSRKVLGIPRRDRAQAVGLWTLAGCWCAAQLTDGHLGAHMVSELGSSRKYANILVSVGLWELIPSGSDTDLGANGTETDSFLFHNWSRWQPTREQVMGEREAARERMQRVRSRRSSGEQQANFDRSSESVRLTPSRPVPTVVPDGTTSTPRTARKRHIPDDWSPNPAHTAKAVSLGLDLAEEVEKFRDYDRSKGPLWKDFDAAFNNWLRNNAKWGQSPRGPYPSKQQQTDDLFDAAYERALIADQNQRELTS